MDFKERDQCIEFDGIRLKNACEYDIEPSSSLIMEIITSPH